MNSTQLECFLEVAANLNFARAAENLHITQPAVTHQINSLEAELHTKLFRRTTRTVKLTDAGLQFLEGAKNILGAMAMAKERLENASQENLPLHIGCHNASELRLLPPVLRELYKETPGIRPVFKVVPLQQLKNLLLEESVDLILGYGGEFGRKRPGPGIYYELLKVSMSCAVANDHPLAERQSITQKELYGEKMVVNFPNNTPQGVLSIQGELAAAHAQSDLIFCDGLEGVMTMVQAGFGFAAIPDIVPLRQEGVRYIPILDVKQVSYGVYYRATEKNTLLKRFMMLMKAQLNKERILGNNQ